MNAKVINKNDFSFAKIPVLTRTIFMSASTETALHHHSRNRFQKPIDTNKDRQLPWNFAKQVKKLFSWFVRAVEKFETERR